MKSIPRPQVIRACAPMRLDLAGGWTDVPPFSTEQGGAVTNVAITRDVQVTAAHRDDGRVRLVSDDYHRVVEGLPDTVLRYDGELDLLKAAVNATGLTSVEITVSSSTPPGAGLGASAAVGVALLGALASLRQAQDSPWLRETLAERAHRLEVDEIGVAGGRQDQYAALNGGFQFLEFRDPTVRATSFRPSDDRLARLKEVLILGYTGRSRVSGTIIATVMGNYQRGERRTTQALQRLKALAEDMRLALTSDDLDAVGPLLLENWGCQKDLDPSVTTAEIDGLFELALRHGATGGKALGAGGGGCLLFFAPDEPARLAKALGEAGVRLLNFDFDFQGLKVEQE